LYFLQSTEVRETRVDVAGYGRRGARLVGEIFLMPLLLTMYTAAASADAGTTGAAAGASGGKNDAVTAGAYQKGVVVFTIAKGGAMFDVSVDGQKFSYNVRS
jgi:hypothetical protein